MLIINQIYEENTTFIGMDYSQVLTNAEGCDIIVTLHLTVTESVETALSETACDSYEWHGASYTESGDYMWTGQTAAGCDSIVTLHLTLTVGIDDWAESISISPNPTYGKLRIENGELKLQNIRILDVFGKQETTIPIDERQAEIDFSSCAAGVYLLKIETENGVAVRKVVKK